MIPENIDDMNELEIEECIKSNKYELEYIEYLRNTGIKSAKEICLMLINVYPLDKNEARNLIIFYIKQRDAIAKYMCWRPYANKRFNRI